MYFTRHFALPKVLLLLSYCALNCLVPSLAQFGGGEACTPGTAPPPELKELDNPADLLPGCSLPDERDQKSAISETTAQQLALCNSFCVNRVLSGDFTLSDAQKQALPGYPVWLLATQSYLLSDQGTSTDCLVGSNSNGCSTDCNRFTPPFDFFNPMSGGYLLAQDCKEGCMRQFETPESVTDCGESCRLNCKSVSCQCPFFGDGCFADTLPPCGRDCSASSCQLGCGYADSHLNSNSTYPAAANPTQSPLIAQIANSTSYLINISNSISSSPADQFGFSTIILRVLDLSSSLQDDITYYVLDNGFEFDLAPFVCRQVEVSFAVATNQNSISDYSPSTTLHVTNNGPGFPGQLADFIITVEQDNRPGFYQRHIIHLEWDPPPSVGLATGYTITLLPVTNPICSNATFSIADPSRTNFTIKGTTANQPPITSCNYLIQIEVNPRVREDTRAQKATGVLIYNNPSIVNIDFSCSSLVNEDKVNYDIIARIQLDETFTPAVISAIDNLRIISFDVDEQGTPLPQDGIVLVKSIELGDNNVTQGPVSFDSVLSNFPPLSGGNGYTVFVSFNFVSTLLVSPPFLQVSCDVYDVAPIPPGPVQNVEITFKQVIPRRDVPGGINITLHYMWLPPDFLAGGISTYQVWLERRPALNNETLGLHLIVGDATSDELQTTFYATDANFTLYFQIRAVSTDAKGDWSEPITFNVLEVPPSAFNVFMSCSSTINVTTRSYDISIVFHIDSTFSPTEVSAIESIRTTIIEVDRNGRAVPSNIRQSVFPFESDLEMGPGSVTIVILNKKPLSDIQSYYSIQSLILWNSSFPSLPRTVGSSCQLSDVGPFRPDPVTNIQLLSVSKTYAKNRESVKVSVSFNWTTPEFTGEEIVGYQVWLGKTSASENLTRLITHGALETSAEVEMTFDTQDEDFYVILQIRALGANTIGNWSQSDNRIIEIQVPCPQGFYRDPSVTSFQCIPCPDNTNTTVLIDSFICPCLSGYFRAPGEDAGVACSRPPSMCRNIRLNLLGDSRIDVVWERPTLTGRNDFYYILWYAQTSPTVNPVLSETVPSNEINGTFTIVNVSEVVSHTIIGLKSETVYSIIVTVMNGVSDQDDLQNEHLRTCQVTATTLKAVGGSFSLPSTTTTTLLGCSIDILCSGMGFSVLWRYFGTQIQLMNTTNRFITVEQDPSSNVIQSHLLFDPVMIADDAAYVCIVIDQGFTFTSSLILNVNNTKAYIEPIEDIEISSNDIGSVITVACRVSTCQENAEIAFVRDSEILNRVVLFSGATSVILNTDMIVSDNSTGNYRCLVTVESAVYQTEFKIKFTVTCPQGTYANTIAAECLPCPANTNHSQINSTVCPCLPGYFRTSVEGPETDCTSPPTACQNIEIISIGNQSITVQWEKPIIIGRDDFYYILNYSDGESGGLIQVINQSQVVSQQITTLKPSTEYTITVTVVNGVSNQDIENEFKRMCRIAVSTLEGVPSSPTEVMSYGDVIVWEEPLTPNGEIVAYEIRFIIPGTQLKINRSRNRRGTFYAVQDEDLLGGPQSSNTFFQVRARTEAGPGQWSEQIPLDPGTEGTTSPPTTCPPCTTYICAPCPPTPPPCTCGTETPTTSPQPLEDIHFVLKGRSLANNSLIALADVREIEDALICRTNLTQCCGMIPNRFGQFYYPSGTAVPINKEREGFYRNRGDQEIRLHRREGVSSPTGRFRCEIPDSNMVVRNLFITLV